MTDGDKAADALGAIETPSTHKDDAWAIFTAPEGKSWNLSKVAIHLPNNNKGTNDNDEAGIVNKEISIAVGNDINNLTRVKTFSDLGEVSELEYILPDFEETKYIAVICNLNPYFYPSLAEVEAYEQFAAAMPAVAPVVVKSGWNADVIAEGKPAKQFSDNILDNQGWVFYTEGVQKEGALCGSNGIVTTANGTQFQIADFSKKNALTLRSNFSAGTLEFENPEKCEELYFLVVSANGKASLVATAYYTDNTHTDNERYTPQDWYTDSPSGSEAVYGLGRIITKQNLPYYQDDIDTGKIRLYEYTMKTDKSKEVKNVEFTKSYGGGGYITILGISRKGTGVATGIENIENRPSASAVNGIYTINGMKINTLQKGINIIKMADGTTRKVVIK